MALRFDFTGLFAGEPGPHRLTRAELEAALPEAARVKSEHEAHPPAWRGLHHDTLGLAACRRRAEELVDGPDPVEALVVLGIGGSALGTAASAAALAPVFQEWRPEGGRPRLFVLDSIDPDWMQAVLDGLPLDRCHFNVVSKSGGTLETSSQFLLFFDAVHRAVGSEEAARRRFTLTTDPKQGHFRKLCDELGFASLPVPHGVGGRFSVLSPVGLFPAELCGWDTEGLLAGAARVDGNLAAAPPEADPALIYALAHVLHMRRGRNVHVHFPYGHRLRLLADWFRQIWAESLGKRFDLQGNEVRVGPTPAKAVGPTDQHSQVQLYAEGPRDKVFTLLKLGKFGAEVALPEPFAESPSFEHLRGRSLGEIMEAERRGTEFALLQAGQPVCTLELCKLDAFHLGQYFLFFEVVTAYAGGILGIDPYDQPGVEAGKVAALALMGCAGYEERSAEIRAGLESGERFELNC